MSIIYLSGGLLGDFIHQLSIINENYIKTGKKGILYIADIGDKFRGGLNNTYNDLYQIVTRQDYIQEFKIYNNEKYDINLSEWRYFLHNKYLCDCFKNVYDVEWGKHQWLNNIDKLNEWSDKIIINTTDYRFPSKELFEPLKYIDLTNYIYVSIFKEQYEFFTATTGLNVKYYCPTSLLELCIIINSCKKLIGSLSAPLSIATGLHKNCVYGIDKNNIFDSNFFGEMNINLPFIEYSIT
jgi:hypothetical protein